MALEMPSGSGGSKGHRLNQPVSFKLPSFRSSSGVPRSQVDRLWIIGGSVAAAAILLIAYVALINPQRSSTSDVKAQSAQVQTQIGALQSRISALQSDYKNLPKYQRELAAAKLALPADSGVSAFLRELQHIGAATSTSVTAVTVSDPVAVVAPAPVATAGATPSAAPTTAAPAAGAATGPIPGQVYSMGINATVSGSVSGLDAFLMQLQKVQPRAVLITQMSQAAASTAGDGSGTGMTLALTMQAFVQPGTVPASS